MKKILVHKIGKKKQAGTEFPVYLEIEQVEDQFRIVQRCNTDACILEVYSSIEEARKDFAQLWWESQFSTNQVNSTDLSRR